MGKILKSTTLSSIGLAILGALLFFKSETTIVTIAYVIGGVLISIGMVTLLRFLNSYKNDDGRSFDIFYGVVTVILGIIVINNPKAIASIIPFIIGMLIILTSTSKFEYSLELRNEKNPLWKSTMILSIATCLVGVLLIFNPFKGAEFITKIVGALIFIYAILDIITTFTIRNTVKQIHNAIEESIEDTMIEKSIEDAEIIEDKTSKNKKRKTTKKKTDKKESKEE